MDFQSADGFERFRDDDSPTVTDNVRRYRNVVSPFSSAGRCGPAPDGEAILDTYYGLTFDALADEAPALYGLARDLPGYGVDRLANYGFLRVPFRKIPRRSVTSKREILEILGAFQAAQSDWTLLWRGQTSEHLLKRSAEARRFLYGEGDALEPSLQPSATRRRPPLEDVLPQWCALIDLFAARHRGALERAGEADALARHDEEVDALLGSEHLHYFALALAQHYGLPTHGLDVTDSLEVALHFALVEPVVDPQTPLYRRAQPRSADKPAVLYLFSQPRDKWFDYDTVRPTDFPYVRPLVQQAKFLHLGWGKNRNAAARQLLMAFYLDPRGDFGPVLPCARIYPSPAEDPFGRFLAEQVSGELPEQIGTVLANFHWVLD